MKTSFFVQCWYLRYTWEIPFSVWFLNFSWILSNPFKMKLFLLSFKFLIWVSLFVKNYCFSFCIITFLERYVWLDSVTVLLTQIWLSGINDLNNLRVLCEIRKSFLWIFVTKRNCDLTKRNQEIYKITKKSKTLLQFRQQKLQ